MPAYNLILYAKWVPIVYTVTFDSQGGSAVPRAAGIKWRTGDAACNPDMGRI